MRDVFRFLIAVLTSQDELYGTMSWLEFVWVVGLGVTFLVCIWGVWDTFIDLYYRLDRNRQDALQGIELTGIAQASSIRAWANVRNAIVWIVKAFLYEVVGVLAALTPPNPNPTAGRAIFPVIFLFLGGLLVYQVLADRRDRQRTWDAIGLRGREGYNDRVDDLAAAALEKVEKVEQAVHVNIELTKKAVSGTEEAIAEAKKTYKEANNVNLAIKSLGLGLKGVQAEQATERERRESDDTTSAT